MGLDLIPAALRARFQFEERDHACAILARDFRSEFADLLDCLAAFTLKKSHILTPGGGRSPIPITIDGFLAQRGWQPKHFAIQIEVDGLPIPIPTHSIDNFKNRVGDRRRWDRRRCLESFPAATNGFGHFSTSPRQVVSLRSAHYHRASRGPQRTDEP